MKNKLEIESLSKKINERIKKLIGLYPASSHKNESLINSYLLFRKLNKNIVDKFYVINTKKDENGNVIYITRNDKITVFFDHTTKVSAPWFAIKEKEKSFSYKPFNFDVMHQIYNGREEEVRKMLEETLVYLEQSISFFKIFHFVHKDAIDLELSMDKLIFLTEGLSKEYNLALTVFLPEKISTSYIEHLIVSNHKQMDYEKEISQLFESSIAPLLIKKDKYKDKSKMDDNRLMFIITGDNEYNQNSIEEFKKFIDLRTKILKSSINKANFYLSLNDHLTNDKVINTSKRNKV